LKEVIEGTQLGLQPAVLTDRETLRIEAAAVPPLRIVRSKGGEDFRIMRQGGPGGKA
jgi:hypothetical protein